MAKCALCKSDKEDNIRYGEMLKNEGMALHTFCLYLTSNLCQRGEEDEGFLGFLPEDIKEEARRVSKLICCYCSKRNANIGCCKTKCRRTFHLICGIENGVQNQFVKTYKSYCHQHVDRIPNKKPSRDEQCCICYEKLQESGQRFDSVNMLLAPCCSNGWFHKLCLQTFAMSAGYFFKCPLCNDTQTFCQKLPYRGIFIPNRDASWELEPNAFAELLERPSTCTAAECRCVEGRRSTSTRNPLLLCNACGSKAIHKHCLDETSYRSSFYCSDCNFSTNGCRDSQEDKSDDINAESDEEVDVGVDNEECDKPVSVSQFPESRFEDEEADEDEEIRRSAVNFRINIIRDSDNEDYNDGDDSSGVSTSEENFGFKKEKSDQISIHSDEDEINRPQQVSEDEEIIRRPKIKHKFNLILDDEEEDITIEEHKSTNLNKNISNSRFDCKYDKEDSGVVTKRLKLYHTSDCDFDGLKNMRPYDTYDHCLLNNCPEDESEDELQTLLSA